jgi:hypothetical protein
MQHESSRAINTRPIATRTPRRLQIRTRTTLRHCDRCRPRRWDCEDFDFYLHRGGLEVLRLGRIGPNDADCRILSSRFFVAIVIAHHLH